jgi:hypothetical protein
METGRIECSNLEGVRIRIDDTGETVHARWRDSNLDPMSVGHGTLVTFYLINDRRRAMGVKLRRN